MEIGTVDGYDYSVDNEGNIINSFNVEDRESSQDYGAIISYDFGKVRDNLSEIEFWSYQTLYLGRHWFLSEIVYIII